MKVTYFVNTMVLLEGGGIRVLCDPWVTFGDDSTSGFYNFPRCSMTREQVAALAPDYIYVTHTHSDHFDPTTLGLFDMDTPVLVSWYKQNFTERMVRRVGFRDVRVAPQEGSIELKGGNCAWIRPAAHTPEVDSIAVFRLGEETVANANDNTFDRAQCEALRATVGKIDVALLPSGAHGPWPMFYENYTDAEKKLLAKGRAQSQADSFIAYIEAFHPKYVIPFAGGIVCGGPKALQYSYSGIRPRSEVVAAAREAVSYPFVGVMLSEGSRFDSGTGRVEGQYVEKTHETERAYLEKIAAKPSLFGAGGRFFVERSERIDLTRLLTVARQNMRRWQGIYNTTSAMPFYFDVGDSQLYRLSMGDDQVSRVAEGQITDDKYEIFRLPYELLLGILTRHYVWSNVNTQHMSFFRKGDPMDAELFRLINYFAI